MRAVAWSRCPRPVLLAAGLALLVLPLAAPVARADTGRGTSVDAGDTIVGELVQGYADPGPAAGPHPAAAHEGGDLLSWVRTGAAEAVRVPTEDVADLEAGSTVEVTLGATVRDEASADGLAPAHDVLAAEVVGPPVDQPVAPAAGGVTHQVTVVMLQPSQTATQRAADGTRLDQLTAMVAGPVADFWSTQTGGAVRFGVVKGVDWTVSDTATCRDPYSIWRAAASAAAWTAGPGRHLLVYVPRNSPGCAYGLGTVGSAGVGSGGLAYVMDDAVSVVAHEFGHNLGLGHSSAVQCDATVDSGTCAIQPYRDFYDVMGLSWGPVGSLNAAQAARIGAVPDANVVHVGPGGGSYALSRLDARDPAGTWALRLVDSSGAPHWLEYRAAGAGGQDSWLATDGAAVGLEAGVLLRSAPATGEDTSLLFDGSPSPSNGWQQDRRQALPVGQTVPVARGELAVTVQLMGETASVVVGPGPRAPRADADGSSFLNPGESLAGGQRLVSPAGRYQLTARTDGDLVVQDLEGRVLWRAGVSAGAGARTVLQADGNLVVYSASGQPLWNARTHGNTGVQLVLQDDGNLVLYRSTGSAAWWTGQDVFDQLRAGQQASNGQSLVSPSGRYRAVAQADGNVVVYAADGRVLWHAGTHGNQGARAVLQADGNLVVYAASGRAVWNARTHGSGAVELVLQDDGNLVLYRADRSPVWWTGQDLFQVLRPGQQLRNGQSLTSPDGRYRTVAQPDGNLVVYAAGGRVLWHAGTQGNPSARTVVQADGNVVVYATSGRAVWNSRTNGSAAARLVQQDDGNLVLYRADGSPVWWTGQDRS